MKAVDARGITFRYKGQRSFVLENVNFELEQGRIAALTGPSGCGKSTLGYSICGVIPTLIKGEFSGAVTRRGRAGIVFQDPDTQIFLPIVEDELAFGPENICLPREEIGEKIRSALELIGLTELRMKNPAQLSGGQKQLVALAGVLTLSPDIIVFDETLSQLDLAAQDMVKKVLLALKREDKTLIMIEHKKEFLEIADEIWFLNKGELVRRPSSGLVTGNG